MDDLFQTWRGIVILIQKFRPGSLPRMLLQPLLILILVLTSLSAQNFVLEAQGSNSTALTPRAVGLTFALAWTLWSLIRIQKKRSWEEH